MKLQIVVENRSGARKKGWSIWLQICRHSFLIIRYSKTHKLNFYEIIRRVRRRRKNLTCTT